MSRRRQRRRPGHRHVPLDASLDLHGSTVADAVAEIRAFLQETSALGCRDVLLIHGRGTGTLARLVKDELDRSRYVESHRVAAESDGGRGARRVQLVADLGRR